MLKIETRADLQQLIDDEIQESLTLDYKASPSLARDSRSRDELCKDVSAFSNSAGGQIVYGIEERDRKPVGIDAGSDLTREWIEQVIGSNVQPRVEGLVITPIPLSNGRHAYALTIPQASGRAPHQAPDKKYNKRQNFQSVPMEDYEIRDALRRSTTPDLFVMLSFMSGDRTSLHFQPKSEMSDPVPLMGLIGNRSAQPAFHTLVRIGIAASIRITKKELPWSYGGPMTSEIHGKQEWMNQRIVSPPTFPIFKELEQPLDRIGIPLGFSSRTLGETHRWPITVEILTPGFSSTETWFIHQQGTTLRMLPPGHPLTRRPRQD
jgi:hypothetical protein